MSPNTFSATLTRRRTRTDRKTIILVSTVVAVIMGLFFYGGLIATSNSFLISDTDPGGSGTISTGESQPLDLSSCTDFFNCTLRQKILETERFLRTHKRGQPYTPDPRSQTVSSMPYTEEVRLNIIPQIQGYANLYSLTGDATYLKEAQSRMDYVISLGSRALARNPWDGHVGFVFLDAFQRIGGEAYRQYGLEIADACLTYRGQNGWGSDNILNWGYMCGMADAKAYAMTGQQKYLDEVRRITRRTGARQNADGGFPHLPFGLTDTGYSSWMMEELLAIRHDDALNPDADVQLERAEQVLLNRVNPDGSLNYADATGNYANNPGGYDTRGWTAGLSGLAYYLRATGHPDETQKVLTFLFQQAGKGNNRGGYPDKWGYFEPDDPWSSGNPSVLRTSGVFAGLTLTALVGQGGNCVSGSRATCIASPTNCPPALAEFGLCNQNVGGVDRCINGQPTKCLDYRLIQYSLTACGVPECTRQVDNSWKICTVQGPRVCVSGRCGTCIESYNNISDCYTIPGGNIIPEQCSLD